MEEKRFINIQLFADEEETAEAIEETVEAEEPEAEEPEAEEVEETSEAEQEEETTGEESEEVEIPEEAEAEETEEKPTVDWEERYKALENKTKKTLKQFGIETERDDLQEALDEANAELEGVSVDEYRKKEAEEAKLAKAKLLLEQQEFDEKCAVDLTELKKSFSALADLKHLTGIGTADEFKEFAELRDKGLSPKRAYLAIFGEKIVDGKELAAKQRALSDSKAHLKSNAPKGVTESFKLDSETLQTWRDLFPDKTIEEIKALYLKTK